jgi:hypothetical protein
MLAKDVQMHIGGVIQSNDKIFCLQLDLLLLLPPPPLLRLDLPSHLRARACVHALDAVHRGGRERIDTSWRRVVPCATRASR